MEDYNEILKEFNTDYIANYVIQSNYGKPLDEIYELIQLEYYKHMSNIWLPGNIIIVHPRIHERRASKNYYTINDVSIRTNQQYIDYHALLVDITSNRKYVLRSPLRFELGDYIPYTISQLETLEQETGNDIGIQRVRSK